MLHAHSETMLLHKIFAPLGAAPAVLLAYAIFSVTVTFADWVVRPLASESFRSRLVPYTGWVASMFYAFTIFFAFALMYQQKKRNVMRFGITLQLLLSVLFGAYQFVHRPRETFGNPYLTISHWRLVWTMLIPSIWIALLHSPRMNRFCRETNQAHPT